MLKSKKALSILLVLLMAFTFSMTASAVDSGTVTLTINGGTPTTVSFTGTTTVDDIVDANTTVTWSNPSSAVAAYSPLYDTSSPLYGLYSQQVRYLASLNGISSAPYEPIAGSLDADDYYIPTQTVDAKLIEADEALAAYGGLDYWYGDGYGFAADWQHMVYIGVDWVYTVNGEKPGKTFDPADPVYGDKFQYTMRECQIHDGDSIELSYESFFMVF